LLSNSLDMISLPDDCAQQIFLALHPKLPGRDPLWASCRQTKRPQSAQSIAQKE
jgi:hypothetical protein